MAGPEDEVGAPPSEPASSPSGGFVAEMAEAFRRLRPQGSVRWNFSDAFGRLERRFGSGRANDGSVDGDGPEGQATDAAATGVATAHSLLYRLGGHRVAERLQPWIENVARGAVKEAMVSEMEPISDGFDATIEAFRFLGARVEHLEDATTRWREPLDAVEWLAPAPDLVGLLQPIVGWLGGDRPPGTLVHGECGDGRLAEAMSSLGAHVLGAEPRAPLAWEAAERGIDVRLGSVVEMLRSRSAGSIGGLVLSGVVDREPTDELVELLALATDRLAGGAPVVVVGTRPEVFVGWDAVARDLLPGHPLHAETWQVLLARSGYEEVGRLDDPALPAATGASVPYAVKARSPR